MGEAELLSLLPAGFQGITGLIQSITGANNTPTRPQYTIPNEVYQASNIYKNQSASPVLPGASTIAGQIGGNTAAGVNNAIQAGNPNAAIGSLVNNENTQMQNLGLAGVEHQDKALGEYSKSLGNIAGYKDKAFELNQLDPYNTQLNAANKNKSVGLQNIMQGLLGGTSSLALGDLKKQIQEWMHPKPIGDGSPTIGGSKSGGGSGGGSNNTNADLFKILGLYDSPDGVQA